MREKNKNQISVFLMVVGVLFVIVAGSICVTRTWGYLSENGKKMLLFLAAAGLFLASAKLTYAGKLKKTEVALFYLGVAFTGFFVVVLSGGMAVGKMLPFYDVSEGYEVYRYVTEDGQLVSVHNALKVFTASLAMLIPVGIRFFRRKKGLEFCAMIAVADGIMLSAFEAFEIELNVCMLILAAFIVLLSAADAYGQKSFGENVWLKRCISVMYLVHCIFYGIPTFFDILCGDGEKTFFPALVMSVFLAATGITYVCRKHIIYRVCNSLVILCFVYVLIQNLNEVIGWSEQEEFVLLAVFIINTGLTLWLYRKEMIYAQISFGVLMPFYELLQYWFYSRRLFLGIDESWRGVYYPFSLVLAAGFAGMLIREKVKSRQWNKENDIVAKENTRYLAMAGVQVLAGLPLYLASINPYAHSMAFHFLLLLAFVTLALLADKHTVKSVCYTAAIWEGVLTGIFQPYMKVPKQYCVEWGCFLFGIGIVLLKYFWYDKKKVIEIIRFAATCGILSILLFYDLFWGKIGNVLILGGVGVVMLVAAAANNRKEYVIASSSTLILLVLYLTREFWLSIEWWIYLLLAGVILIFAAIKRERAGK